MDASSLDTLSLAYSRHPPEKEVAFAWRSNHFRWPSVTHTHTHARTHAHTQTCLLYDSSCTLYILTTSIMMTLPCTVHLEELSRMKYSTAPSPSDTHSIIHSVPGTSIFGRLIVRFTTDSDCTERLFNSSTKNYLKNDLKLTDCVLYITLCNGLFHFLLVHPPLLMTNRCPGGQS